MPNINDEIWERIGRGYANEFSHWELFAEEKTYWRLLKIRRQMAEHRWGKMRKGDSSLICDTIKDLEAVANSLYLARQELIEAEAK